MLDLLVSSDPSAAQQAQQIPGPDSICSSIIKATSMKTADLCRMHALQKNRKTSVIIVFTNVLANKYGCNLSGIQVTITDAIETYTT